VSQFNPIQTQVFTALFNTDDNVLLAAPAGSGKIAAAEFALLRMIQRAADGKGVARAVYIGPTEAIAAMRFDEWTKKFSQGLGLNVVRLTGEGQTDVKLLDRANIAISTPEAWDALSRRWRQRKAVQEVALFIVDEMHLIGGPHGPALEVVTSRMRYISSQLEQPIRVVALAASLANARDLGDWLGVTNHAMFNFPPSARPVPVDIHVNGFSIAHLEARMQAMTRPAYQAVCRHTQAGAQNQNVIVFVPTRRHARMTALDLLTLAASDGHPTRFLQASEADLDPFLDKIKDAALRHSLKFGVAFVHEAQSADEHSVAKMLFDTGAAQVLVATAPTVWGMSSTAKAVLIMGTQYYDVTGQGTNDYSVADVLQMVGKAGRPDVDSSGTCVVMLLICFSFIYFGVYRVSL